MKTTASNPRLLKRTMLKRLGLLVFSISLVALSIPLISGSLLNPRFVHAQANDASQPTLQALGQVTNQAYGTNNDYIPNSWGMHKTRIIRMSTGDLFTVYTSAGSGDSDREWHLMRKAPGGNWQEVHTGDAGQEPINIIRGPNDELHLFAWPGTKGQLQHIESKDLGQTFTTEMLPGQWAGGPNDPSAPEQGYSGAGVNDKGDIVICQTNVDKPGTFRWAYYDPTTGSWQFHLNQIDNFRFTYFFLFPGENNDLSFVGMRDATREELGYPPSSGFDYVFDEISYFHISDVNNPTVTELLVAKVKPKSTQDYDLTYLTDAYVDTQGNTHILYDNLYDGPHHAIIQNGAVVKDVKMNLPSSDPSPTKMRIIQNATGQFSIIDISNDGNSLYVYPGATGDTDGTQLTSPTALDISQYPACSDDDFCHAPTFTMPRSGNPLSDMLDGVYGNFNKEIYFRIQLPDSGSSTPTPTATSTSTPTNTPTPTPTPTPTNTPTPTPTLAPPSYRYSFEDGTTDQWEADSTDVLQNSTQFAFDGTHSLKAVVNTISPDTHPLVYINNWAIGSSPMPAVGQTITAEVYVPSGTPAVKASIFVEDSNGNQFFTSFDQVSALPPGSWVQLQYTVPSTINGQVVEYGVGFNFPASSSRSMHAYIDAVNW